MPATLTTRTPLTLPPHRHAPGLTSDELTAMISQAKQLEDRWPRWIIIAGRYSRQFLAFPRFRAGFLIAGSLTALETGMRNAETQHREADATARAARRTQHQPAA